MSEARSACSQPRPRVILLGASNLTRAISTIIETSRLVLGTTSLDVFAAMGHGRSYGIPSRVLIRGLPAILQCGLWEALDDAHARNAAPRTYALITDVGNDIMYEQPPALIDEWIDDCLERLCALNARIVITALPLARIERLSARQYCTVRSILFPGRSITFDEALSRAREVDERLRALATRHGASIVELRGAWYGIDPIHIRQRYWPDAWRTILSPWVGQNKQIPTARPSVHRWLALRRSLPHRSTILGFEIRRRQPVRRLPDGSSVSFF